MICFESDALSLEVLLQLRRHVASGRLKLLLELSQTESKKKYRTFETTIKLTKKYKTD
jgi:hypothetical protein